MPFWTNKNNQSGKPSKVDRFHGDLEDALAPQNDVVLAEDEDVSVAVTDDEESVQEQTNVGSESDDSEMGASPAEALGLEEAELQYLKDEVHKRVLNLVDLTAISNMSEDELRSEVRRHAEVILSETATFLSTEQKDLFVNEVIDETFGLGPLESVLRDDSVTDIMINGAKQVYVERNGRLKLSNVRFADDAHVIKIIQRIVGEVGRRVDETSPMVDARLRDGSRLNALIPPLALDGPLVSIRRFGSRPLQAKNLLENNSITQEMVDFLDACAKGRLNMLISGGTGSGKTTLLNIMSGSINDYERVATIEDAAELQLQQSHVIRMETRPPNIEGEGAVSTRDLVRNALRMRPDRIIIGECRGPEALDMLQAMNTGHDGSLTTIHANTPRDALMRLEMMVGMTGVDIPIWTIRRQIASAINIVIQAVRLTGGVRKVVAISEITGMEGEVISMHDIFRFQQTGLDNHGCAVGYFESTGVRPQCAKRLEEIGLPLDLASFEKQRLSTE